MTPSWITYANQGATRNQPLDPRMYDALSFLGDMGITAQVFSGGQPGAGASTARVGSTRHDHGLAGDMVFYKDGRKLDWSNPDDVPYFQEIVRRGKANGLTGFGAGPGYMQAGSVHVGFGQPAVWGAGGSGANAPDWLREAYGTAPASGGNITKSTKGGPGMVGLLDMQESEPQTFGQRLKGSFKSGDLMDRLALAFNSMRMNPDQGIAQLVSERQKGRAADKTANRTAQWLASIGRDDLAQAMMSGALDPKAAAQLAMQKAEAVNGVEVGGKLVNPRTGELIYDPTGGAAPTLTSDQLSGLNTLRDDAAKATTELTMMQDAWSNISTFYSNPGSVSDKSLVVAFAKILDPTSVVRESESAAIANAGSLSAGMRSTLINTLQGGGNLPPEVRDEIVKLSQSMLATKLPAAQRVVEGLQQTARAAGLPPELIFFGDLNAPPSVVPPAPTLTPTPGATPLSPNASSYIPPTTP